MEENKKEQEFVDNNNQTEETDGSLNYEVEVSLEESEEKEILDRLMADNPGKEESDLAEDIEKLKEETLSAKKEQAIEDLKKIDEVKAREGNAELSDEDAWEIALKEEEDSTAKNQQEDILKDPFSFDSDTNQPEKTDNQKLEEMQAKVKQAEGILSDPMIDGYIKFKQSGNGSFRDYLKSFEVDKDFDSMPAKTIYKMGIERLGLSDEDLEYEMDAFDDLSPAEKAMKVRSFRNEFKAEQNDRLKNMTFGDSEAAQKAQEIQQQNERNFMGLTKSMNGKSYYGLDLTEEMTKAIHDHVVSGKIGFVNADGTVNVKKMFDFAAWDLYKKDVLQGKVTQGRVKGQRQEFIKRSAPKRTGVNTSRTAGRTSDYSAYQKAKDEVIGRRGVNKGNITL
jgi:hypothetical protein